MNINSGSGRPNDGAIDQIVAKGLAAVRSDRDETEGFVRGYFAHVDVDDIERRRPEDLFGMAAEHLRIGMGWESGEAVVRVINPRVEVDGWASPHSFLLTVTDDLPFLVDSVTVELSRLGIGIHLVVHPVLVDMRPEGELFGDTRTASSGNNASFISIEIDRQGHTDRLEEIEQSVQKVLADVRAAVEDWQPMRDRVSSIAESLADEPTPVAEAEVAEAQELLRWLADDHFILLGYREYSLEPSTLSVVPGSGLGILRGEPRVPVRSLDDLPPQARARAGEARLLNLTKAGSRSTVHRSSFLDYIGVKTFDASGTVTGERRFVGLYTSEVYTQSATKIPRVRRLMDATVERAGFPKGGHDEKRLLTILEDYPRDELLQIDADELFETAIAITGLQERRRVRLFARAELFGRFVTCMVYIPRDRYNTETRTAIEELLADAYGGNGADWTAKISDSVLARLLIHVQVDSGDPNMVNTSELEIEIERILRVWDDDFATELIKELGEDAGVSAAHRYRDAFPSSYHTSFAPRIAVADLAELEQLVADGDVRVNVYRIPGQPDNAFKLKLYRRGERVSLTSVMPSLTNLGMVVVDEQPYEILTEDGAPLWIYDFSVEHPNPGHDFGETAVLVEEAFVAVWNGEIGDDGFNRMVLGSGISARDLSILRVYARYLHQTGIAHSQEYIENTLGQHPDVVRTLVDLFIARFDPSLAERNVLCEAISGAFTGIVDEISSLDQDRILRRFHNLITHTLRTNFFQVDNEGKPPPYIAVKLDSRHVLELPEPRPDFEIFVHSPRFEAVHLRSGPVARGGLRWSDRNEDFRTEVLGLVKAQMVKNAVIVPSGAKGGFVLSRPPSDPQALRDEVVACYRLFISALLDLTDNLVDGEVVGPPLTVRQRDDTYLVVAADKGTATFSDIANELALERGFWLGDAFASGGSQGYDHKGMGITARGAWESVKQHLHELDYNIQDEPFTVVGVGDMSGDVFGNGMLLSSQIRLVAAFDHRHIFIDPDPDPTASFAERRRLFEVPRSSWADYNTDLLSAGGGVYPRTSKSINLSPEARAALGVEAEQMSPAELMSAVLRAPVDLLWNGGIGTYVKASTESHADVGDKANDAIRVDGCDLRAKVVGEGGNLGFTQRARVEFARNGGRINTDAIDNAGGVDCSDHEVNIKIAIDQIVAAGDLTAKQRNKLLADMTAEVASLVLANNHRQTQALSEERVEAASMVDVHERYMASLVGRGLLDRNLEFLPDAEAMADRRLANEGLTAPEIAVLMAYSKNTLNDELLMSSLPDDAIFEPLLLDYFPQQLRERHGAAILNHRLRREIIANRIANLVVDRAGPTMVYRLSQETSAASHEIAAAHIAAWEIFKLDDLTSDVNELDASIPALLQLGIHLSARQLAERATRQLLRTRPAPFSAAAAVSGLAEPVRSIIDHMPNYLVGTDQKTYKKTLKGLLESGMAMPLAERIAVMEQSLAALDIVDVADECGVEAAVVAGVHFAIADELQLNWLRDRILALPRDSQLASLARLTLRGDLYADHRALTTQAVSCPGDSDPKELVGQWARSNHSAVDHFSKTLVEIRASGPADLTMLLVSAREVRNLIGRAAPA